MTPPPDAPYPTGADAHDQAPLPRAVLWDLDGTLMNTEPYWMLEEAALVEEYGGVWTEEDAKRLVGQPLLVSAECIRDRSPVTLPAEAIVDRLQGGVVDRLRGGVPWRPGAVELLTELRALGVPQALVTMSWRPVLEIITAALPQGTFQALVTGDIVTQGKPHPEPYLRGLSELGLSADDAPACVAIEDSETGAASAVAAGIPTLVVPCVKPVDAGPGLSVLDTLDGMHAHELVTMVGARAC